MENFSGTVNWNNIFKQSENFKNNKPFKFGFIEEFLDRNFYEKLYETYPKFDDSWNELSTNVKFQYARDWNPENPSEIIREGDDPTLSKEWNQFKHYLESNEFVENFKKFSGIPVNKLKALRFIDYRRGGFTISHIHNEGPSTLVLMAYFSKNWQKGDPGGTFMATDENEDSIIFEPYNLDNSLALFHDGPKAFHGTRYITKDIERRGSFQITLEEYSPEFGWSAGTDESHAKQRKQKSVEIN